MIEVMEQQIIDSINNRWTKDKSKRRDIDINKVSDSFRVICSSRVTNLIILDNLRNSQDKEKEIQELRENMIKIYDWIIKESINGLIAKYHTPLKNKKKEEEYKLEIPDIENFLEILREEIISETLDKLLLFHKI